MKIEGEWFNELGSKVILIQDKNNSCLYHGTYHTAVGTAQEREYELVGYCGAPDGNSQTIRWVVSYEAVPGEQTICTWSGQVQTVGEGAEAMPYITTTWILRGRVLREENGEAATEGINYFFRSHRRSTFWSAFWHFSRAEEQNASRS